MAAPTTSDHRSSRQNAAPARLQPPRRARAGTPPPLRSNISNLPLPRRRDSSRCVFFLVPPSHLHLLQLSGLHRATIAPPSLHHTRAPPCFLASEQRALSFTSPATTIVATLASPAVANASSVPSFSRLHRSHGNHHGFSMEATTSSRLHLRPRRAHVKTASTPFTLAPSWTASLPWQPPHRTRASFFLHHNLA